MSRLHMPDFRLKLMRAFALLLLASFLVSSALLVLICAGFTDTELLRNQADLMEKAVSLYENDGLSPARLTEAFSTGNYLLRAVDDAGLTEAQARTLDENGSVITGYMMAKRIYFRLGDVLMAVDSYPANTVLVQLFLRSLCGSLLIVTIGLVIAVIITRRIAQPIVNLTNAAREIAYGNYDVQIDPHLPRFTGGVREIADMIDMFNVMARELKNVEYLRRDFTSNLSHELKSPVASISGYARLLQCDGLTEENRREYAQAIYAESGRLSRLSDNLLKLTRLESSKKEPVAGAYSLDEQLRRCATAAHPEIERKHQTIDVELQRVNIEADEALLSQVWTNLLDNAIKFTPEGGKIRMTLTHAHGQAVVTIADNGIGMDEDTQARAFEKFYQADPSRHVGGNGLGLALVKRIAAYMGATVELKSAPGQGAQFTISLPERQSPAV